MTTAFRTRRWPWPAGLVLAADVAIIALAALPFAAAAGPGAVLGVALAAVVLSRAPWPARAPTEPAGIGRPALVLAALLAAVASALPHILPPLAALGWWTTAVLGAAVFRHHSQAEASRAARSGNRLTRLAVIGAGDDHDALLRRLFTADREHRLMAVIAPRPDSAAGGFVPTSDIDRLVELARQGELERVILALPPGMEALERLWLARLKELPLEICRVARSGVPGRAGTRALVADLPVWRLAPVPQTGAAGLAKAALDRGGAALALLLLAPVLLLIALGVKLSSPGPVLYRQERHGYNNRRITVLKFRTLYQSACDPPAAARIEQVHAHDPRVTPFGRLLRRSCLDELPQLWNVVRGEMSLVGPRPHALAHNEGYGRLIEGYMGRHRVKPGLTGLAQVRGCRGELRSPAEMRRRVGFDLAYIESWSLGLDARLLLRTLFLAFAARPYATEAGTVPAR